MTGIKKLYRAAVLKAVFYARQNNSVIDRECDTRWRRSLTRMSEADLLRQFRRLIAACSERAIGLIFANDAFRNLRECLCIAAETVIRRGRSHFAVLAPLIREYNSHRELLALLEDTGVNDAMLMLVDPSEEIILILSEEELAQGVEVVNDNADTSPNDSENFPEVAEENQDKCVSCDSDVVIVEDSECVVVPVTEDRLSVAGPANASTSRGSLGEISPASSVNTGEYYNDEEEHEEEDEEDEEDEIENRDEEEEDEYETDEGEEDEEDEIENRDEEEEDEYETDESEEDEIMTMSSPDSAIWSPVAVNTPSPESGIFSLPSSVGEVSLSREY